MQISWRKILFVISRVTFIVAILSLIAIMYKSMNQKSDALLATDGQYLLIISAITIATFFIGKRASDKPVFKSIVKDYSAPAHKQYRGELIQRVRNNWIKDVYEQSLHHFLRLKLELKNLPEVVPRQSVCRPSDRFGEPIQPGTSMLEIFSKANKNLLILGKPGSGKTTLLLELTRDLLDEAEKDAALPIPIIFNLSSWAKDKLALTEWMLERLHLEYGVNKKLGETWIKADLLIPLLDGLDEVRESSRTDCVATIHQYKDEHGLNGLVVCSQIEEYQELSDQLNLRYAIEIQPLGLDEAKRYLRSGGAVSIGLLEALDNDTELQELAQSPLTLNIMGMAYKGQSSKAVAVAQEGGNSIYQRIFQDYVDSMFKLPRKSEETRNYSQGDTVHYLSWLACQMTLFYQTEFYLEQFQKSWLPDENTQRWDKFLRICVSLMFGLIGGLGFALIGVLMSGVSFTQIGVLIYGLIFGLAFGLSVWTLIKEEIILHVDILKFSWYEVRNNLSPILILGLVGTLVIGMGYGLYYYRISFWICVLMFWLVYGLLVGLCGGQIEGRGKPNLGIRNSFKNWLSIGLSFGLFGGLNFWLSIKPSSALIGGLSMGLFGLLIFGIAYGGAAFLNHYIIRYVIRRAGFIPHAYVDFLNHAHDRSLLRKKGGGYIFIHSMLLEYFATIQTEKIKE